MRPARRWLTTHRGYDPGALPLAKSLSRVLRAPLVSATTSRLLIELNRSLAPPPPGPFSPWSAALSDAQKQRLIETIYRPFRDETRRLIEAAIRARGSAVHLSVHTFTPVLRGTRRPMHVGILFDPSRVHEAAIAQRWCAQLAPRLPRLRVELNRPYLGTDDGHTTALRTWFSDARYAGLELEVRQDLWRRSGKGSSPAWKHLVKTLAEAFKQAVET